MHHVEESGSVGLGGLLNLLSLVSLTAKGSHDRRWSCVRFAIIRCCSDHGNVEEEGGDQIVLVDTHCGCVTVHRLALQMPDELDCVAKSLGG